MTLNMVVANTTWLTCGTMVPSESPPILLRIRQSGTARVEMSWKTFWEARPMMASLDHAACLVEPSGAYPERGLFTLLMAEAMWFHHAFPRWRADEWLLYVPNLTL